MNLWIAPYPDWVGEFDPTVLPVQADYDRVAVYRYTPGSGDAGTSGDFSLLWEDSFEGPLDADRWIASAKGAIHSIGGTVESRLKEVRKLNINQRQNFFY